MSRPAKVSKAHLAGDLAGAPSPLQQSDGSGGGGSSCQEGCSMKRRRFVMACDR